MSRPEPAPATGHPNGPVRPVSWRRRVAALLAGVAVLVAYSVTLERLLANVGADVSFASAERDGDAYLRPLVTLLAVTADAQSAAVAGRQVDGTRLTEARTAVAAVDARYGASLRTTTRWNDLARRLDAVTGAAPTGADAYARYSAVIDLELALVAAVGDASNLILDPQLDVYYVMDSVLLRLPGLVVSAGRVSDLNRLAGGASITDKGLGVQRQQAVEATRTERLNLAGLAGGVDTGLRKSFGTTRSRTLGPALLARLDRLRDATSRIAPPAQALGADLRTPSPQDDETVRRLVRDAALALEASALDELDTLLRTRIDGLAAQRRLVIGAGSAAGALLLLAGWMALPARRRETEAEEEPEHVAEQLPVGDQAELIGARELLEARRLVRSGRAISTSRDDR